MNCSCWNCKEHKYNREWDAYYCRSRNVWLEHGCGADCENYHCSKRPKFPDMERRKKEEKIDHETTS